MNDTQYRKALFLKALANISNSSAPEINRILMMMADGRGNAFVRKLSTMYIQHVFYYAPEPYEYALISGDVLPVRPAAVGFDNMFTINPYFGFSEAESWQPWGQAPFAAY